MFSDITFFTRQWNFGWRAPLKICFRLHRRRRRRRRRRRTCAKWLRKGKRERRVWKRKVESLLCGAFGARSRLSVRTAAKVNSAHSSNTSVFLILAVLCITIELGYVVILSLLPLFLSSATVVSGAPCQTHSWLSDPELDAPCVELPWIAVSAAVAPCEDHPEIGLLLPGKVFSVAHARRQLSQAPLGRSSLSPA